jgi:hypothetical protein
MDPNSQLQLLFDQLSYSGRTLAFTTIEDCVRQLSMTPALNERIQEILESFKHRLILKISKIHLYWCGDLCSAVFCSNTVLSI